MMSASAAGRATQLYRGLCRSRRSSCGNRMLLRTRALFSSGVAYDRIPLGDHGPYQEFSVIHTDRSLNLMSPPFQTIMKNLHALLKETYNAEHAVIIPGSGTFGMESVARQFAFGQHSLVLRNGWFSYRWTEILEMGQEQHAWGPNTTHTVLKAVPVLDEHNPEQPQYTPAPIEHVLERIETERPKVFFMPHVETSTGMLVPEPYIRQVADAMHRVGGLLVVDCIASGTIWLDMAAQGIDVLISAPQKGWTGPPCAALVLLSDRAKQVLDAQAPNQESSFSLSLKRWSAIMDAYVKGGFAYHTTMPTDALRDFHQVTVEAMELGMDHLKEQQWDLGRRARALLESRGLRSVAAPDNAAPGVLVYYSPGRNALDNPILMAAFQQQAHLQIAMGVPWKIDEPAGLKTFRIGLFGLPKLTQVDATIQTLEQSLDTVLEHLYQHYPQVRP